MSIYHKDFLKNCHIEGNDFVCNHGGNKFTCDNKNIQKDEKNAILDCNEPRNFKLILGKDDPPTKVIQTPDGVCFESFNGNATCIGEPRQDNRFKNKSVLFNTNGQSAVTDQNLTRFIANFSLLDPKIAEQVSTKINQVVDEAIKKTFLG